MATGLIAAWPHCRTCSCSAPVPDSFQSNVRALPVDLDRECTYRYRDGRTDTYRVMAGVRWEPDRHNYLIGRIRTYEYWLRSGRARNVREAVRILAIARREAHDRETIEHAERLRRWFEPRIGVPEYARALARKKELVLAEDGPCAYCGDPNPRTVDHIMPTSRGGDHRRKNLTPACKRCNSEKNNRTPDEWRRDRIHAGLPWPPVRESDPNAIPRTLTSRRVTPAQMRVLRLLEGSDRDRVAIDVDYRTLEALERNGLIGSRFNPTITDRGRLALETGRLPR